MASPEVQTASVPRLLSTSAAGRRIGVTKAQAVRLANEGQLVVYATLEGGNDARVFTEAEVERFVSERAARKAASEAKRSAARPRVAVA